MEPPPLRGIRVLAVDDDPDTLEFLCFVLEREGALVTCVDRSDAALARLKAAHGHVVLWDGHSIRSELPWLFEGKLPDLNLGTANGASCAPTLRAALMKMLARQQSFSHVTDGRFKGGHITRHYGRPDRGVHAVQLEMCWSCYMKEEPPWVVDPRRAARLQPVLQELLQTALDWKPDA
jgi:N-formylglutamate deformylase